MSEILGQIIEGRAVYVNGVVYTYEHMFEHPQGWALPRVHKVGQWARYMYLGMIHALVIHAFCIEFHF